LILPGQSLPASSLFLGTLHAVEAQIGRQIEVLDITSHPDAANWTARGRHDWDANTERVWLNPSLGYDDQEAVAAHELAHVLQKAEGYCHTATRRDKSGQPIFPQLALLGTMINSMVLDVMADRWAASRGSKVVKGLEKDAVPRAAADIESTDPSEPESIDWEGYRSLLMDLAAKVRSGGEFNAPVFLGHPEIKTQGMAVGYASLCLRLSPHSLFGDLDRRWAKVRPEARRLGSEVVSLVSAIGYDNREKCEACIIAVIEHLRIPPPLIVVKKTLSDQVIWPSGIVSVDYASC
jgi:hypothetical protein